MRSDDISFFSVPFLFSIEHRLVHWLELISYRLMERGLSDTWRAYINWLDYEHGSVHGLLIRKGRGNQVASSSIMSAIIMSRCRK